MEHTEEEIVATLDSVVNSIANKFTFGYFDIDDIKQQGRLEGLKALSKYDPEKGNLANFLYNHIYNRLCNLKRDKLERPKPCLSCPLYDKHFAKSASGCEQYEVLTECGLYKGWLKINSVKRNLCTPAPIGNIFDENEKSMKSIDNDGLEHREIIEIIEGDFPVKYRHLWIKLRSDIRLTKKEMDKVREIAIAILTERGICPENVANCL